MHLSSSQGCLAGWVWEDGEADLANSDDIGPPEDASLNKLGSGRLETHVERIEEDVEDEEEEEEEEEEIEFHPRRKLWAKTDTVTSIAFETQSSTRKASALLPDERPPSEPKSACIVFVSVILTLCHRRTLL